MPSPFPGMNPYLEREGVWHDFHNSYVPAIRDALALQVVPNYVVSLEEHVYIHEPPDPEVRFVGRADLSVRGGEPLHEIRATGGTAVLEAPVYTKLPEPQDTFSEPYIEIRDRDGEVVITVIELLSPTNKRPGSDRGHYLAKRKQYLASSAHYVEIDLLRGGERMPADDLPDCDYCVLVRRSEQRPRAGVWPLRLRDRLPLIPIPLRAPDPDARLDLQELLHQVYDRAGYRYRIYAAPPRPPLHPEDARWAEVVVVEHIR